MQSLTPTLEITEQSDDPHLVQTKVSFKHVKKTYSHVPVSVKARGGQFQKLNQEDLITIINKQTAPKVSKTKFEELQENRLPIGESERKYVTKLKERDEHIVDGTYDEVIPEHSQFEHVKSSEDKIVQIFQHTNDKVLQVTERFIDAYNNLKDYKTDLQNEPTLKKAMRENIAFPLDYRNPLSFSERKDHDVAVKFSLKKLAQQEEQRLRGKNYKTMLQPALSINLMDPNKLARMQNAFDVYKMKAHGKSPQLMLQRYQNQRQIIDQVRDLGEKVREEIKQDLEEIKEEQKLSLQKHQRRLKRQQAAQVSQLQEGSQADQQQQIEHNLLANASEVQLLTMSNSQNSLFIDNFTQQPTPVTTKIVGKQGQASEKSMHRIISTFDSRATSVLNEPRNQQKQILVLPPLSPKLNTVTSPIYEQNKYKISKFVNEKITQIPTNGYMQIVSRSPERRMADNPNALIELDSLVTLKRRHQSVSHRQSSKLLAKKPDALVQQSKIPKVKKEEQYAENSPYNTKENVIEHQKRLNQVHEILKDVEHHLTFDPSLKAIKQNEVQLMIERYRSDQNMITSDQLQYQDNADSKHMKKLYNYGLVSMRDKQIMEEDLEQEFKYNKNHLDPFMQVLARQHEQRQKFAGKQKIHLKKKLDQIYAAVRRE